MLHYVYYYIPGRRVTWNLTTTREDVYLKDAEMICTGVHKISCDTSFIVCLFVFWVTTYRLFINFLYLDYFHILFHVISLENVVLLFFCLVGKYFNRPLKLSVKRIS